MSAAAGIGEITLDLPWDVIDAGPGIAIDIGGSVMKVLYAHKDEYIKPSNRKKGSEGQLHLVNYAKEELNDAFEYIKKHAYIKRGHPEETVKICTTGIGGSQFGKRIKSELNVMNDNVPESDCFLQSFKYLLRDVSRIKILHEIDRSLFEQARKKNADMLEMIEKFSSMTNTMGNMEITKHAADENYPQERYATIDKPLHEQKDIYPCMMMLLGSGMGGMLVNEDGSCQSGMMLALGGRMFLGLGCLLTRSKTFAELMELCEKGEARRVGITNIHLSQGWDTTEENNIYSSVGGFEEMIIFFFGQAVGKTPEDFRREDLARCLLEYFVKELVLTTHMSCREKEASTVFFTGGFANHPLIRKLITQEWLGLDGTESSMGLKEGKKHCKKIGIQFLKHGSHLGAIGAYLNSKLHFCDHLGAAAAQATASKEAPAVVKDNGSTTKM